jgi:hypothetical protein
MATLLENQLHTPNGPLSSFFLNLDVRSCGIITVQDLRSFTDRFCSIFSISFVQKKLLFLLITKGYTRLDRSSSGTMSFEDFLIYAPKIQCFLSGTSITAHTCALQANTRYQELSHPSAHLSLSVLADHCTTLIPPLIPNKRLVSLFIAYALYQFCTHPTQDATSMFISKQNWCETALALHFELKSSS